MTASGEDRVASMETIVVGVDGSEGGAAAFEFAAGEAVFRGARLRIVSAWQVPVAAYGGDFAPLLDAETVDSFRVGAQQVADDAFAAMKKLQPSLEGDALAVQGQPADVLLEHSGELELLVVGSRAYGPLRRVLLGSVSDALLDSAACPAMIVPRGVQQPFGAPVLHAQPAHSH